MDCIHFIGCVSTLGVIALKPFSPTSKRRLGPEDCAGFQAIADFPIVAHTKPGMRSLRLPIFLSDTNTKVARGCVISRLWPRVLRVHGIN